MAGWKDDFDKASIETMANYVPVLERDKFTCQCCDKTDPRKEIYYDPREKDRFLEIHHIIPKTFDEEDRGEMCNLVTLCKPCHKEIGDEYWPRGVYNYKKSLTSGEKKKIRIYTIKFLMKDVVE